LSGKGFLSDGELYEPGSAKNKVSGQCFFRNKTGKTEGREKKKLKKRLDFLAFVSERVLERKGPGVAHVGKRQVAKRKRWAYDQ